MKSTGIVRKVDTLGRIVIPVELRSVFGIDTKDPIEIFVDEHNIVLRKYQPGCELCKSLKGLKTVDGHRLCEKCVDKIKKS